jgi:NitT/TauT family transport system substrate-binding protein
MRRRTFAGGAAGLVAASLARPLRAQPAALPVRVAEVGIDLYAEAYYAQDQGFFKNAGLNAEIATFSNGAAAQTAVAAGAADVGVSNPVAIAAAVTHGVPFTVIAGAGLYSTKAPSTALCVAKSSPLKTAKDLEGKVVALSALHDQAQIGIQAWLEKNGADPQKVSFVEVPFPTMGVALEQGRIDVAMIPEPSLTVAINGPARLFAKPFDAIAPQFYIGTWVAESGWAKKNPETVKRFASAIYATARWANAHHDESAVILAKYSKLEPATIRAMTRAVFPESLSAAMIQPPLDAAAKYGLLTRAVSAGELTARP